MRRSLAFALALSLARSAADALPPFAAAGFGVQPVDLRVGCTTPMHATHATPAGVSWRRNVSFGIGHRDAQFLVLRLTRLRLPPGARLEVRAEEGDRPSAVHFDGAAATDWTRPDHVIYTRPLYTQRVVVVYTVPPTIAREASACYGFHIDEYRFAARAAQRVGLQRKRIKRRRLDHEASTTSKDDGEDEDTDSHESSAQCVSSADNSVPISCVQYDLAVVRTARAVARLLVHKDMGSVFCTGWLLGCEGHVITNHHCVTSESEANATTIEFLAQGHTCSETCETPMSCPGVVEVTSSEIVASSPIAELDFTLLLPRLPPTQRRQLTSTYGFLAMRSQAPQPKDRIFIPQHPAGYGKHVALKHGSSYGQVESLSDPGCNQRPDSIGYFLDTTGGSSGAPVISYKDMAVVGLHYCGGCLNSAIPASRIVESLVNVSGLPDCAQSDGHK